MHAAELLPHRAVYVEGLLDFRIDVLEFARLDAVGEAVRVAVHRVADPDGLAALGAHVLDKRRQTIGDFFRAEAMNQCQASRTALRIERVQPARHLLARAARAYLNPDRVLD